MTTPLRVGLMVLAVISCYHGHALTMADSTKNDPPTKCKAALDIGIIMDGSTSVYKKNFEKAKQFFKKLADHFTVSPQGTHFGVIVYSHRAKVEFTMADSRYNKPEALAARIRAINYPRGWTRTDKALELASNQLFTPAGGDRPGKPNVLIVFTDGRTNPGSKPYSKVLPPLAAKGVETIAIGVGKDISEVELLTIAMGKKGNVITIKSFDELQTKLGLLLKNSCKAPPSNPVNGGYTRWSNWTPCTKTCGGGITTRSRTCTNPKPQNGGKDCSGLGPAEESKACGQKPCPIACGLALGLQSNAITDSQMKASSKWNYGHRAANARLHFHAGGGRTGGWSARYNNDNQWLQVDFRKIAKITKIATQGRQDANQWVTSYSLTYSRDGLFWYDYPGLFAGNADRNTVVSHELKQPIFAKFLRIRPRAWAGHISMRAEIYGCTSGFQVPAVTCIAPLGMKSKAIPDFRITASSMWDGYHSPSRARLGTAKSGPKRGAWSARINNVGQWIQVDLGKATKVTRIATQGRQDYNQWVKAYAIEYSQTGGHFEKYRNGKILMGNNDRNSVIGHVLEPAIIARYIRIRPKSWYGHISMRLELYGCKKGFTIPVSPTCEKEFSLRDSQLSASSEWDRNHRAINARLHHQAGGGRTGGWSSRYNNLNQWLQVDLGKISKVTRISTQGRSDANQWVRTYIIEYSVYGSAYQPYKVGGTLKVLSGNADRYTVQSHKLSNPIIAQYIRIRPKSWYGHISMRLALYGCISGFSVPAPTCGLALGLQSNTITDSQMKASSKWNSGYRAANARLHFHAGGGRTGGWSARYNNDNQWLQVDFRKIAKITKIATQGRQDANQWVTSYSLAYSRDGVFLNEYPGAFIGNSDRGTVVSHELKRVIYARYLRIRPLTWAGHISMRAEIYGCTSGFEVPAVTCIAPLGMKSKAIPDFRITASSMWDGYHSPSRARLGTAKSGPKRGAWSARINNVGQWIQVDLGKATKVTRIATQGRQDYNQWVTSYVVQYSLDGRFFEYYQCGKALKGNSDRNSIVGHVLEPAIIARYIRIRPKTWYGHISMRCELYGCAIGKYKSDQQ